MGWVCEAICPVTQEERRQTRPQRLSRHPWDRRWAVVVTMGEEGVVTWAVGVVMRAVGVAEWMGAVVTRTTELGGEPSRNQVALAWAQRGQRAGTT